MALSAEERGQRPERLVHQPTQENDGTRTTGRGGDTKAKSRNRRGRKKKTVSDARTASRRPSKPGLNDEGNELFAMQRHGWESFNDIPITGSDIIALDAANDAAGRSSVDWPEEASSPSSPRGREKGHLPAQEQQRLWSQQLGKGGKKLEGILKAREDNGQMNVLTNDNDQKSGNSIIDNSQKNYKEREPAVQTTSFNAAGRIEHSHRHTKNSDKKPHRVRKPFATKVLDNQNAQNNQRALADRDEERQKGDMVKFQLDGRVESFMPGDTMRDYLNGLVDASKADTKNQASHVIGYDL